MTERPILFNSEMVRAILDGRKSQTRRLVKPQPVALDNGIFGWGYIWGAPRASAPRRSIWHGDTWHHEQGTAPIDQYCPYGQAGDRLWVREKFTFECPYEHADSCGNPDHVIYWATESDIVRNSITSRWRPSIHMPRWASRIDLEITGIRVERVWDISERDAKAEGVSPTPDFWPDPYRHAFEILWNSINAKRGFGWDTNPWVFVISFQKVE